MNAITWIPGSSDTIYRVEIFTGFSGGTRAPNRLAIWSDDGGSPSRPLAPLAATAPFNVVPTNSWQGADLSAPVSVLAGQKYWVVWDPDVNQTCSASTDPAGTHLTYWSSSTGTVDGGASWQGPFGQPFNNQAVDRWKFRVFCGTGCSPDVTRPTLTVPAGTIVSGDASCQAAVPDVVSGSTATDNCEGAITVTQNPPAGTLVGSGVHAIVVTATDVAGNSSTATTFFTVRDTTPPVISCPADIAAHTNLGGNSVVVNFADPTASDNCGVPAVSCSPASGSSFALGSTTVNCTATDAANQTASCSFTVTVSSPPTPTTFVVTSTGDGADSNTSDGFCDDGSGNCTLRAAIQQANATATDTDTIAFNIPGTGVHTIAPASGFPNINQPLIIDGYTQPGASPNTLTGGDNAVLLIELNGASAGAGVRGLVVNAPNCRIRGLVVNRYASSGIRIQNNGTGLIDGNFVGTNAAGTAALPNQAGIVVSNSNNVIGGVTPQARNVVSGNSLQGILVQPIFNASGVVVAPASGNLIQGNFVGVDSSGTVALGNGLAAGNAAVALNSAVGNLVGGTDPGARNVVSGNGGVGIIIQPAFPAAASALTPAQNNTVQGNLVGTDVTGNFAISNAHGILIQGADHNLIGGTVPAARNVVSGNRGQGIWMGNTTFVNAAGNTLVNDGKLNTVQGNYSGTNAAGTVAIPNTIDGIRLDFGATENLIGGTQTGAGNLVSGNLGHGIHLDDAPDSRGINLGTARNTIQGNFVGTDSTGTQPIGNHSPGVIVFEGASDNLIGGDTPGAGNIIAFNLPGTYSDGQGGFITVPGAGVAVASSTVGTKPTVNNRISGNSIFGNDGLGIDHNLSGNGLDAEDGVTPNDSCDPDQGANNLQNAPMLTSACLTDNTITVQGTLDSLPGTNFTIEFYANAECDQSGAGEGQTYLGSVVVTTDSNCIAGFTFSGTLPNGQPFITATAIDPSGNTSEFSSCVAGAPAATIANAGPDQSLCENSTATLQANTPTVGAGQWTLISGAATITEPRNPGTTVTDLGFGSNVFRWTITSGSCEASSDEVAIVRYQTPTIAVAGPNQNLCETDSATMAANVPAAGTGAWALVSGSGSIIEPNNPSTLITNLGYGENKFRWTNSNGACASSSDVVKITRDQTPTTAVAGPNQSLCETSTATLAGNVPTIGAGTWTLVSGSGTITDPNNPATTVTNLGYGANVFHWKIKNGSCPPSGDNVKITLYQTPTVANAGPDQAFCDNAQATLAANTPGVGSGSWTLVSGSGTIVEPNNPNTQVTGLGYGANVFKWKIDNGSCPASTDKITITRNSCISQLTALGQSKLWIGSKDLSAALRNIDVRAEVYKNGVLIGSGEIDNLAANARNFNDAVATLMNLSLPAAVTFIPGDTLSFKLLARLHTPGVYKADLLLFLWLNNNAADSRFDAVVNGESLSYYLTDPFTLSLAPGPGPRQTLTTVLPDNNTIVFRTIGTWNYIF